VDLFLIFRVVGDQHISREELPSSAAVLVIVGVRRGEEESQTQA